VTEPEQRPPQRSQVWLGGEKADPLVLRFVGDRMCLRHCLANGVLDPLDRRRIERPQKPLKQLRQQLRHQFKRPRSGFDRDGVRAGREDQKRYRERGYASNRDLEHPVDRGFNRAHVSECRTGSTNTPLKGAAPKLGMTAPRKAKGATTIVRMPASEKSLAWGISNDTAPA